MRFMNKTLYHKKESNLHTFLFDIPIYNNEETSLYNYVNLIFTDVHHMRSA